jgi:YHS domain-containing protein
MCIQRRLPRVLKHSRRRLGNDKHRQYLKDHVVVDPIAEVRFPKFAAASTLEREGKTYYLVGEEKRREFEAKHGIRFKVKG